MEKISGILKPSSRVTSVDLKDAPPVRPGMPTFGRPEGVSSLRDRGRGYDGAEAAQENQGAMMHWRTKESQNSRAAEQIADRFFMNGEREPVRSINKSAPELPSMGEADVQREPASTKEAAPRENPLNEEDGPVPGELYPKGSFINAVA